MKKLLIGLFIGLIATAYAANPVTFPGNGGTGTSTKPTRNQILIGTSQGLYNLASIFSFGFATSSPWLTSGTSVILATSTNNVGIGTSTPGYPLTVVGTSTFDNLVPSKINGTIVVDGIKYPQTNAGIQAAINDCALQIVTCGEVFTPRFSATITTPITLISGITLRGASTTLTTSMSSNTQGIFSISNKNNVKITGFNFIVNGSSTAVISFGHQNLNIIGNTFSGANGGSGTTGVLSLFGASAVVSFNNTNIENNIFKDMTASSRTVYIYARNGNTINNTRIVNNYFENINGPAIYLDDYDNIENTIVQGNQFKDLTTRDLIYGPAVAVFAGIAGNNKYIKNLVIDSNNYKNTVTASNQNQGFVFFYNVNGIVMTNNSIVGAWSTSTSVAGPAFAPGRVGTPSYGVVISNNYIRGFDAAWDPDSMINVEVANNIVEDSGTCWDIGYQTQQNADIHNNVCKNTLHRDFNTFILFSNSNPRKVSIRDNTYISDYSTGTTTVLYFTGGLNFNDVVITGNRFFAPTATSSLETTRFIYKETGTEKLPLIINNNEVETGSSTTWNSQYFSNGNILFLAATSSATGTTTNGVTTGDYRFTWDNINKRLGLGTSTPTKLLSIIGDMFLQGAFFDGSNASGTLGQVLQSTGTTTRWVSTSTLGIISSSGNSAWTIGNSLIYNATSTDNVGVGTSSPTQRLDVWGNLNVGTSSISNLFVNTGTNRVGILTNSPLQSLQIGSNSVTGTTNPNAISLGATYSTVAGANPKLRIYDDNAGSVYGFGGSAGQMDYLVPNTAAHVWYTAGIEGMRFTSSKTLAIGTTTSLASLFVQGTTTTNPLTIASSSGSTIFSVLSNGQIQITGGSPGLGKLLQSDSSGIASWVATSSLGLGYTATYPIIISGSVISSGFSTSTTNVFTGLNTFQATTTMATTSITALTVTSATSTNLFATNASTTNATSSKLFSNVGYFGSNISLPETALKVIGFSASIPLQEWGDGSGAVYTRIMRSVGNQMSMSQANFSGLPFLFSGDYQFSGTTTMPSGIWNGSGNVGVGTTSVGTTKLIVQGSGILNPLTIASSTGTTLFQILANGNVGVGTSSPNDNLAVVGNINITGSYKVNGVAITSGSNSTSTADYILSKNGSATVVWDTVNNTNTSFASADLALQNAVGLATSTGRSNIRFRSGYYDFNSTVNIPGAGVTIPNTISLDIGGAGGTSTMFIINTARAISFSQSARVNFHDFGVNFPSGTNTAFYASTTSGVSASIRDSRFDNITFVSTSTGHTGYAFDFIEDFRNNYSNIRGYQIGNLWRTTNNYSNGQFINGDSHWSGFNFCELNNASTTNGGECFEINGANGQVNQLVFDDINGISNDSGSASNDVFIKITNSSRISMPSGGNAEQFATTTQIISGNGIFLHFTKYVTQTAGAAGKTFLETSSTAFNVGVTCKEIEVSAATNIWKDSNTTAGQSNSLTGENGANCIISDNGGSALFATSTFSRVDAIYNNVSGDGSLAQLKLAGNRIIMNAAATFNSWFTYSGAAFRWVSLGTERMTLTDAGNLGLGSTTPVRTLSVVGSQSLSGAFYDSLNSAGGAGECLTSTGSATDWASCGGGGGLSGGSTGLLALWSSASSLVTSLFMDNGTVTGIGATSSTQRFNIASTTGAMMFGFGTNGQLTLATTTATTSLETGILGQVKISALTYAGRDILATKIASSSSSGIQSALWDRQITRWTPGATNGNLLGSSLTALTTGAAIAPTLENKYATLRRTRWSSVITTVNQQVGLRTDAQFFRSATSTNDGFFFKTTFGTDANWTAGNRLFVGLSTCTTACLTSTTSLTNLTNTVGFGVEGGTSQIVFLTNDGSGAIATTSIAGLPALTTLQGYDVYLYNPPNSDIIYWRIDNYNTGVKVAEGNVTTNLPARNTMMTAQVACSNGLNTAANACQIGLANMYIEPGK